MEVLISFYDRQAKKKKEKRVFGPFHIQYIRRVGMMRREQEEEEEEEKEAEGISLTTDPCAGVESTMNKCW